MFRKLPILFCFLALSNTNEAQQLPIYSQYMLNEFLINPSVAGVDGRTTINLTGRKQWVGFTNPPETYSISFQTRILKRGFLVSSGSVRKSTKGRVGLGASIISDKSGAVHRTGAQFTYAYHIFIENSQLSFGFTGSFFQLRIDNDEAKLRDQNDPLQQFLGKSTVIPDAGIGFNYMTQDFHVGLAVTQLLQSKIKIGDISINNSRDVRFIRQYYFMGDYKHAFSGNHDWEIEPSVIVRGNELFIIQSDLTLKFLYKREYWAGMSFRTTGDLVLLLGLRVNNVYFGYSFDYGFNGISPLTYGSHEVILAVKLGDSARRYRWLERY